MREHSREPSYGHPQHSFGHRPRNEGWEPPQESEESRRERGVLSQQEYKRFTQLRAYFADHIDAVYSTDPKDMAIAEEFRNLRDRFVSQGPNKSEMVN